MSQQAQFATALLDPAQPCPAQLTCWNGSDPAVRLAVYRNNVTASLVDALAATFPVLRQLVGADCFAAMARDHVRASPPPSPVLAHYGADFPAFVEGYAPAAGLPYLADVARLELLRVRAYHAADAGVADGAALKALLGEPTQLAGLRFALQPALGLLRSPFAVVSLWAAHQGALDIAAVDPYRAENALALRSGLEVEVSGLSRGAAVFVDLLQQGATFAAAAEQAAASEAGLDLAAPLARLLRAGAISGFSLSCAGASP